MVLYVRATTTDVGERREGTWVEEGIERIIEAFLRLSVYVHVHVHVAVYSRIGVCTLAQVLHAYSML
jgi:hypothetical protein